LLHDSCTITFVNSLHVYCLETLESYIMILWYVFNNVAWLLNWYLQEVIQMFGNKICILRMFFFKNKGHVLNLGPPVTQPRSLTSLTCYISKSILFHLHYSSITCTFSKISSLINVKVHFEKLLCYINWGFHQLVCYFVF